MKYFMDTEFIDDGFTIDLISIGIVSSDGREYYAQSAEFDASKASAWVQEHVLTHLTPERKLRYSIKRDILTFMEIEKYGKPELWGWCCGYDWVVFCQLFGLMIDLPANYPHYMHDIQAILDERGISDDTLPQPEGQAHNALMDARQIKQIWEMLLSQGSGRS